MMNVIILVFAIAAVLGATLLTLVLQSRHRPTALILLHGLFAAIAITLLGIFVFQHHSTFQAFLITFAAIAVVGFYMGIRDIKGMGTPKVIAVLHGGFALLTLAFLAYSYYSIS